MHERTVRMNINPTMNFSFGSANTIKKLTTFKVPGVNNTTIVADIVETGVKEKLTNLEYKVMQKGKVIEKKVFQNKKGFPAERLCMICDQIQTKVKEGFDFLDELIKAQFSGHKINF